MESLPFSMNYQPPPTYEIELNGVTVLIRREDLNHPTVSGNKWWKLRYNLMEAITQKHKTILTFGGAFSNHLYATASAAKIVGLSSIGIVRGEKVLPLNPVLAHAAQCGMHLHFISREAYRMKTETTFLHQLKNDLGEAYVIPEGGTNSLAVQGCEEWAKALQQEHTFDYLCVASGTGGTTAGLRKGLDEHLSVLSFPVLKSAEFLDAEVKKFTDKKITWMHAYHFGGYAKSTRVLEKFIQDFYTQHAIPLDVVYTGKLFFGVWDLIQRQYFPKNARVLVIHSGGIHKPNSL